ncbi:hypothetical protein PYV61_08125 [Roseisolibacter sp. H3M3-2]|nr:hypothetical protein [Roseisolibacter sp. H3M3-2]
MLRSTTTGALGAALALSFAAADASAQADTTRRTPTRPSAERVRKETTSTTGGAAGSQTTGAMDASTSMRRDTVYIGRTDTTIVQCNCAATQASGGEVLPLRAIRDRLFGNGLYAGIGAGTTLPVGDAYKAYNEGWGFNAVVGWDPKASPVGVRATLGYQTLNGRSFGPQIRSPLGNADIISDFGGAGEDAKQISALIDAKLRVPFGRFLGATSGVYALAGAGVHHFRNYNNTLFLTNQFYGRGINTQAGDAALLNASRSASANTTRLGLNAGLGTSLGIGIAEIFLEGRYERVFTEYRAVNYVPIVLGVQIH